MYWHTNCRITPARLTLCPTEQWDQLPRGALNLTAFGKHVEQIRLTSGWRLRHCPRSCGYSFIVAMYFNAVVHHIYTCISMNIDHKTWGQCYNLYSQSPQPLQESASHASQTWRPQVPSNHLDELRVGRKLIRF